MAEARDRQQWGHTSALLAMLANCHRDPKKGRAAKPSDFDPYAKADRRVAASRENVQALKALVPEGRTVRARAARTKAKGDARCRNLRGSSP